MIARIGSCYRAPSVAGLLGHRQSVEQSKRTGVYTTTPWGKSRFQHTNAPDRQELTELVHTISHRVAGFLEREGILERDGLGTTEVGEAMPIYFKTGGIREMPITDTLG